MYIYIYTLIKTEIGSQHTVRDTLCVTLRELRHWPSITGMLPQNYCGDEEDGRIGLSS